LPRGSASVWHWLTRALLISLLGAVCGRSVALDLSPEERAWMASHGPVRIGVALLNQATFPYFEVTRHAQKPGAPVEVRGFAADMVALVAERAGLQVEYVTLSSLRDGLQKMRGGQIDAAVLARLTPARAPFMTLPGIFLSVDVVWVTRRDGPPLRPELGLEGLRIAVVADRPAAEELSARFPRARLQSYDTEQQAMTAVADGRADAMPTDNYIAIMMIERQRLGGLQVRRLPGGARADYGMVVASQLPLLHSIVAKALDTLTPAERTLIERRWLPQGVDTAFGSDPAALSVQDHEWVARSGELRVAYDAQWAPITQYGTLGVFEGLGADVLRAAAHKAGLRIVAQQGTTAADALARARSGQANVVVGLARSTERRDEFHFVGPFAQAPTLVVTRADDRRIINSADDLGAGKLALLRDDPLGTELLARRPGLQTLELASQDEGLLAVAQGRADAAIGNGYAVNHLLETRYAGRLRVAGVLPDDTRDLYFGVPKSQPQLARVLGLGFDALTPGEMAALRQRWLLVRIEPGLQWAEVLRWALPLGVALLAIVLILALANRRLAAATAAAQSARAQAEAATAARGRFLAYLAHEVRGLVHSIGWGARMMLDKEPHASPDQVAGWIKASAEQTGLLLDNTLANERTLNQGMQLQPAAHELLAWWQQTLAPHRLLAAQKALQLLDTAPQPGPPMWFDATRLSQVLNNLVGNAIKFTQQGQVRVLGAWNPATRQLRIEVEDTGPGIADADLALLWEPYAQGAAGRLSAEGVGLGLAITRQIVLAMGGNITVSPGSHAGTCFVVTLPLEMAA
jgi:two-component system sensor histidine kinase EvgS